MYHGRIVEMDATHNAEAIGIFRDRLRGIDRSFHRDVGTAPRLAIRQRP